MSAIRIPRATALLGLVLDVQFEAGDHRITLTDWEGWALLTDADAMDRAPGRARLYLAPFGRRRRSSARSSAALAAAAETYLRWHQRDPEGAPLELQFPDEVDVLQGRATRIGYRSDKWSRRGRFVDYDHDFRERGGRPPRLITDSDDPRDARGAVIVGGNMRVTERGID